jgi:hypothetical protein
MEATEEDAAEGSEDVSCVFRTASGIAFEAELMISLD